MNADGSPVVDVTGSIGVSISWIFPLAVGLLIVGALLLAAGILLIVFGAKRRPLPAGQPGAIGYSPYPGQPGWTAPGTAGPQPPWTPPPASPGATAPTPPARLEPGSPLPPPPPPTT
jgi:hypothetical protein